MKRLLLHCLLSSAAAICQGQIPAEIDILQDSSALDNNGYNNCNMQTNGERLIVQKLVKNGDIIFDIGANVGTWSQEAMRDKDDFHIFAFEPVPPTFDKLKASIGDKTEVFNVALSDRIETKNFYFYPGHSRLSTFYQRDLDIEKKLGLKPQIIPVPTDTIENFCKKNGITHIDYLKIDTEGAELDVLRGAIPLIQNGNINFIQFEYGGTYKDASITLHEVYHLLTSHGYNVFRIIKTGLIHIREWRDELENYQYSNYLAAKVD